MNLEDFEKRYKYVREKERLVRKAYETRIDNMHIIAIPSRLHQKFLKTQRELSLRKMQIRPVGNCFNKDRISRARHATRHHDSDH